MSLGRSVGRLVGWSRNAYGPNQKAKGLQKKEKEKKTKEHRRRRDRLAQPKQRAIDLTRSRHRGERKIEKEG